MSVASAVYDKTCVVCDWVNNTLRRIWLRVQRSRQLPQTIEYMKQMKLVDNDAGYHLANMNDKTNQHYDIELSKTKRITCTGYEKRFRRLRISTISPIKSNT